MVTEEVLRRKGRLVVGVDGHGQLYSLVLGFVSASCAAIPHCPVLIIHDRDET